MYARIIEVASGDYQLATIFSGKESANVQDCLEDMLPVVLLPLSNSARREVNPHRCTVAAIRPGRQSIGAVDHVGDLVPKAYGNAPAQTTRSTLGNQHVVRITQVGKLRVIQDRKIPRVRLELNGANRRVRRRGAVAELPHQLSRDPVARVICNFRLEPDEEMPSAFGPDEVATTINDAVVDGLGTTPRVATNHSFVGVGVTQVGELEREAAVHALAGAGPLFSDSLLSHPHHHDGGEDGKDGFQHVHTP